MTLIEQIQNFKVFEVGTFVINKGKLYRITALPKYKYTIRYTDGDFDVYYTDDWEQVRGSRWEMLGYGLNFIENNELDFTYSVLFAKFELFDLEIHSSLMSEFEKFKLLLAKRELDDQLRKIKNAK